MTFREFSDRYLKVRVCAGCKERISYQNAEAAFCPSCSLKWNQALAESCPDCFHAYPECTCMPKTLEKAGALCLRSLFRYSSKRQREPQNKILYAIKHYPNKRMVRFLAAELLPLIREELNTLGVENAQEEAILVHLPRSRKALNRYGFDQSDLLCEALSELSGIPHAKVIARRIGGKEQKKLSRAQRRENLKGLLYVKDRELLQGHVVLLLDDVITTGASLSAAASVLKKEGASAILCFCLAKNVKIKGKKS